MLDSKAAVELIPNDNVCFFYDSELEWRITAGALFKRKLEDRGRCLYLSGIHSSTEVRQMLAEAGIDVVEAESRGHLIIQEPYYPEDLPESRISFIINWITDFSDSSLQQGYNQLCIANEFTWLWDAHNHWDFCLQLMTRLNRDYYTFYPTTTLSCIPQKDTQPLLFRHALLTHPVVMYGGKVYRNPLNISLSQLTGDRDILDVKYWLKKMEDEVISQERLQMFTRAFEGLKQPLAILTLDGHFSAVNQALCQLLGLEQESISSLPYIDPELFLQFKQAVERYNQLGRPHRMELPFIYEDRHFHFEVTVEPFRSEDGNLYYYVMVVDITNRKQAEEEYHKTAETYRLIADTYFDLIALFSLPDFIGLYVSPSIKRILGYDPSEITGRPFRFMLHEDDSERVERAIQEGMKQGFASAETRVRTKDGSYRWIECNGRIITGPNGEQQGLVFSHDIDDRKRAEEALRSSEQRLRQITDNMLDCIFCMNSEGIFTYVSPSVENIFGYTPCSWLSSGPMENLQLLHAEDKRKVVALVQRLLASDSTGRVEFRARHAEGHYIWLESVGKSMAGPSNIREVIFATREITQRKIAEQHLREQLDYLNTLIENMNEMLYIYDEDLQLTFMNSRGYRHLQYDPPDVIGRSVLDFIPDSERAQVIQEVEKRLRSGQPGTYETNLISGDGSLMPVRVKSSPLIENGKVVGGLVVAEDITEWIKVEKEMARLAQLHVVGEIAAGIGHEIRNPMTTVQGFLQLLSTNEEFSKYQSYFEVMMEELERANDIISEFLSLARDKMVNLQESNLNNLLTSMAPLLQADALLSDKQVRLRLQDIPDLRLDVKEIRQLILNLVRNGLEAMPAGGTITISTRQEDDQIILSVQDEGGGIMPDIMDKIGTPFFTTKEQGTGLGLAVCYGIVSRHKAAMDILTGPQGTTFSVIFSSR